MYSSTGMVHGHAILIALLSSQRLLPTELSSTKPSVPEHAPAEVNKAVR